MLKYQTSVHDSIRKPLTTLLQYLEDKLKSEIDKPANSTASAIDTLKQPALLDSTDKSAINEKKRTSLLATNINENSTAKTSRTQTMQL